MKYLYIKKQIAILVLFFITYSGMAQSWQSTNSILGDGATQLQDLVTDGSDNLYSLGIFTKRISSPVVLSTSTNVTDKTCIIRYDASGAVTFSQSIEGGSVRGYRMAVDAAGNMYIAGSLYGSSIRFGGFSGATTLLGPSDAASDGFVAKYSSAGIFMWVRAMGTSNKNEEILDMAISSNGDIYVTGYISDDAPIYGKANGGPQNANLATITSQGGVPGSLDIILAKFSNDGDYQWGFSLGSVDGSEKGTALTIDASDNVYVAGQLFNTINFDPDLVSGTSSLTEVSPQGSGDAFIAKYSSDGAYLNVGQISGASDEIINSMHIGGSGVLNVAGTFRGFIDADPRNGNISNLTAAGTGKDILFSSYNLTTFAPVFLQNIGGSNVDDEAIDIKTNSSGDIYLTGYFSGSNVNFNSLGTALNLTSKGGKDIFISKYNSTGINQWGFGVGSTTDDQGSVMAFNSMAMVYAGGYYSGTAGDFNPGSGTSNLVTPTGVGMKDSYWSKYQECSSSPVITTQPSGQTVCAGTTINLNVAVTGSGVAYKWKKGGVDVVDGGNITGATTNALKITSSLTTDAGTYTCVATSCGISVTTNNAVVVVNAPPIITTQPISKSICSGVSTTFSVIVSGTLPTYQWKLNGTDITNNAIYSGAKAATLNIVGATTAQAGDYTCVIGGTCTPVVTSNIATLTVSSGITITTNPVAKSSCIGGVVTFTTAATGTSLTYQWQKNGVDLTNGGTISGATTTSLTINGVVAGDATNYKCVITSSCGNSTTTAAILSITTSPSILTQPSATQSICVGQSATFSVVASGATTYQWKKGAADLVNGGNISGATSSSLVLTSISASDAGTYTCVITGACNPTVTTNNSVLTVNSLPVITTQPTSSIVCQGLSTNFSVAATGTSLTYQWQRNSVNVVDGGSISGAQTNTLTISNVAMANAGNYTCIVSGVCSPNKTSNIAALTVNSTATISTDPVATVKCEGQTTTFNITTSGSGITYQWKKGSTDLVNGGNISGALTPSLTITNTALSDAGSYSCTIVNSCSGTQNSATAALTVNALPVISTQPTDVTICGSSPVSFTVAGTGTGIAYQWKKGGVNLADGGAVSGATTATLSINPAIGADAGAYTCVISGTCSPPVTSNVATLAVGSLATITTQPINKTVCAGSSTTLSITVSGTGISYQWKKDGVDLVNSGNVSGATTANVTLTSVSLADAASYTCVTGNTCSGFLTSDPATVTVNSIPVIVTQPTSKSICAGLATSFSVSAAGTSLTYQWKKDGVNLVDGSTISGAQSATVSLSSTIASDAGTYICEVSGACTPMVASTGATLALAATSSIVTQPVSKTACTGTSTVFTCNATGGSLTYKWKKGGIALVDGGNIAGASTFTLTISNLTLADADDYVCEVSSSCSSTLISNTATLTVSNSTVITLQPVPLTKCESTSATFDVVATGTGLLYQWMKGSTIVSGATNANYTIGSVLASDAGSYTCDIMSSCGLISSNAAVLTVNSPAIITGQPTNVNACPGDNATISIVASGSIVSYQWFKNSVALVDGGNITGSSTNALVISAVSSTDVDSYSCQITALCGPAVTSSISSLSLSTTPVISTQPMSTLICTGQTLSLSISVSSASTIIYQWKKDNVNIVNNATVSGAQTATLMISSTTAADAGSYTCSVSTSCSTPAVSNAAVVTTTTSSPITQQPISSKVCKTHSVKYTVVIAGAGITYKWQFKANGAAVYTDLVNGGKFSGVSTSGLSIVNVDITEEGAYRCLITEVCGAIQNSAAAALIIDSPTIIQHPFPQSVCLGQLIQFDVAAIGGNLLYQWYKDGLVIANGGRVTGASSSSLKITGSTVADNGEYTCTVIGSCLPVATSQPATLTVSVCTGISIHDLNGHFISIYPKPANESTTIEIKDKVGDINISLFDMQGSLILNDIYTLVSDNEKIILNTSTLPQGMYLIRVQMGDEFYSDKFEVIH